MDPQVPSQTQAQSLPPQEPKKSNPLVLLLIFVLVIIIIIMTGGLFFLDEIKTIIATPNHNQTLDEEMATPSSGDGASQTAVEDFSDVVCRRFTDIEEAIKYYPIACGLDLSNQNLSTLPDDISALTNLHEIDLSNNNFSEFPEVLTTLTEIVGINLADNRITTLPTSVTKLTKLQSLNLANNFLTSLPSEIDQITTLNNLVLSGNNISTTEQTRIREFLPIEKIPPINIEF